MPELRAFRGLCYDPDLVGPIETNVAEPYDKITPAMREDYLRASGTNVAQLLLPRAEEPLNSYGTAARILKNWVREGKLRREEQPAFYIYDQTYSVQGVSRTRRAFLGLCEASSYGEGKVLPHEQTFRGPKEDRAALLHATRANFGVVFLLYRQPGREAIAALEAAAGEPRFEFTLPDGTEHRLTPVTDPKAVEACQEALKDVTCVIADGHHRYETSYAHRLEAEERSSILPGERYRLAALVETSDSGLTVLPTHRMVPPDLNAAEVAKRAEGQFTVEPLGGEGTLPERARAALEAAEGPACFVALDTEQGFVLTLKAQGAEDPALSDLPASVRKLDVTCLHKVLLEGSVGLAASGDKKTLGYVRHLEDALEAIGNGKYGAVVALRPASPEDVIEVAKARATMPQKSTDFYPKMLSGLVVADLAEPF
ncbi:MAG: DUF1015 domain-containing protein [Planctomycetota bacterium]|jgi:uncharacterized protein (DUF1015 family)